MYGALDSIVKQIHAFSMVRTLPAQMAPSNVIVLFAENLHACRVGKDQGHPPGRVTRLYTCTRLEHHIQAADIAAVIIQHFVPLSFIPTLLFGVPIRAAPPPVPPTQRPSRIPIA